MACWFFNVNDVVGVLYKLGYKLSFKSRFIGPYLGIEQEAPQDNFPKKFRIGHSYNLLFAKNQR
jgi:hypothetical protein